MCIIVSCVFDIAVPDLLKSASLGETYTQVPQLYEAYHADAGGWTISLK